MGEDRVSSENPRAWQCPACGEKVPHEFDACWNCGVDREGQQDEYFAFKRAMAADSAAGAHRDQSELPEDAPDGGHPATPRKPVDWRNWWDRRSRLFFAVAIQLALLPLLWWGREKQSYYPRIADAIIWASVFIAGAVQRRNMRQIAIMALAGAAGPAAIGAGITALGLPVRPLLYGAYKTSYLTLLAVSEWVLLGHRRFATLAWLLFGSLAGGTALSVFVGVLRFWHSPLEVQLSGGGATYVYLEPLLFPLLAALTAWLVIGVGTAAAERQRPWLKAASAAGFVAAMAAYVFFFGTLVFRVAARSLKDDGPFSGPTAIGLLDWRGSDEDVQALWEAMEAYDWNRYAGTIDAIQMQEAYHVLTRRDPSVAAERFSELLRSRPCEWFARLVAEQMAEQRRYETAPLLMRYAFVGSEPYVAALEKMGVPEVAIPMVLWTALFSHPDWQSARFAALIDRDAGTGLLLSKPLRERLLRACGCDQGPRLDDWLNWFRSGALDRMPSPLTPRQRKQISIEITSRLSYEDAWARWHAIRNAAQLRRTEARMITDGKRAEYEAAVRLLADPSFTRGTPPPPHLKDAVETFVKCYRETSRAIQPREVDWNTPSTDELARQVQSFIEAVRRLEEEEDAPQTPGRDPT